MLDDTTIHKLARKYLRYTDGDSQVYGTIAFARAIEQAAIQQQALEYTSLFDQCSEALDRVKALEAKCALLAASLAQEEARSAELAVDRDSWRDQASQRVADWDEMRKERDAIEAAAIERCASIIANVRAHGGDMNAAEMIIRALLNTDGKKT